MEQLLLTFILLTGFTGMLAICEAVYRRWSIDPEYTRKGAHVLGTLSSLLLLLLDSHWYVLFLGSILFIILYFGKKTGFLRSINEVKRETYGSILLPAAIYLAFLFSEKTGITLCFLMSILILGVSDTLAALAGMAGKKDQNGSLTGRLFIHKSIIGSIVFFISSFIISFIVFTFFSYSVKEIFVWALILAAVTTVVELISIKGTDNFTIPVVTCLLVWMMINYQV